MNTVVAFPAAAHAASSEWTAARLERAKRGFATRRLRLDEVGSIDPHRVPRAGDLTVARVTRLGQHTGLQQPDGRRATLFVGDEIIIAFGNRYAPDQFEALVPDDLGPCALAAGGGIAARVVAAHARMKPPTQLLPFGVLCDHDGRALNVSRFRLPQRELPAQLPPVIVVAGTSMNAGKTTAAAQLVQGLTRAGLRVGAGKLTGTGACADTMLMRDAGAVAVLDFTDVGLATTYLAPLDAIEESSEQILAHLASPRTDAIVVEIADGLYQAETAALLRSPRLRALMGGLLFASPDAMGAVAGLHWLLRHGLRPLGLAGAMTASPLAVREAEAATALTVYTSATLADPQTASRLLLAASMHGAVEHAASDTRRSA
jgi:hypothetical protein